MTAQTLGIAATVMDRRLVESLNKNENSNRGENLKDMTPANTDILVQVKKKKL